MNKTKEKQLPLAIGLNLLLAGAGYIYMGKWLVGIFAMLLIVGIFWNTGIAQIFTVWVSVNLIMAIDMYMLFNKNQEKLLLETSKKCPSCAETILKEAKVCRFCNSKLEQTV